MLSLPKRAVRSAHLYRQAAWTVARRGPVLMMRVPLALPGARYVFESGRSATSLLQNLPVCRPVVKSMTAQTPSRNDTLS